MLEKSLFSHTAVTSLTPDILLTAVFVVLLLGGALLRFVLLRRHISHVRSHRDAVPSAFVDTIPLTDHQRAADYTVAKSRLALCALAVDVVLCWALTLGGGIAWVNQFWAAYLSGMPHTLALLVSVAVVMQLVNWPLELYGQFVIEERFGFNRMTWRLFIADTLRQMLLMLLVGLPLIAGMVWIIANLGEYWWWWAWCFWCGINVLLMLVYPVWIAPLFNRFSPLPEGEMRVRIEQLLARCGFHAQGLFVMDGSKRSSHGNAYFTGFGKNKRIVIFDTLLDKLSAQQTEAVLAHELGHFRAHHVLKRMVFVFAASLAFFYLLGQLMNAPWFYTGLGASTQQLPQIGLALLLFFVTLPVFLFPISPLWSFLSRRDEYAADHYAATHSRASDLIAALVRLYQDNGATLTPDPWYSRVYDSHPGAVSRIHHLQRVAQEGAL